LIYRPDERSAFIVMVARSFAADAWTSLQVMRQPTGTGSIRPARSATSRLELTRRRRRM
jgi:hypothetical protein